MVRPISFGFHKGLVRVRYVLRILRLCRFARAALVVVELAG
jgi:hypothetical protein